MESGLGLWDCIVAPCIEPCAVCQDVPEYDWWIAQGDPDKSLEVILARNPMPGVTGYVCTHLCQTRCIRNDYEETVAHPGAQALSRKSTARSQPYRRRRRDGHARSPSIGSGPSGFSAAFYLALNGVDVTIFEARTCWAA